MNAELTPLPVEEERVRVDGARWFLGYMPIDEDVRCGGGIDDRRLPPLPEFSVAMPAAVVSGFSGKEGSFMEGRLDLLEVPCEVEVKETHFTDVDLHEVLADLMVCGGRSVGGGDGGGRNRLDEVGEIGPMLRAAARRAVFEVVNLQSKQCAPKFLDSFCGGVKTMVEGWNPECVRGEMKVLRQVIGLQLFRKCVDGFVVSVGEIPEVAVGEIVRLLENENGLPHEFHSLGADTRIHFASGAFCILVAVICGEVDEEMAEDLDYLLRRIERRMERRTVTQGGWEAGVRRLLEDGLLICSPTSVAY